MIKRLAVPNVYKGVDQMEPKSIVGGACKDRIALESFLLH